MLHRSLAVLFAAAVTTSTVAAQGQATAPAPAPPPTYEATIARTWMDLHDNILVMPKDTVFPDDKLGWKPHQDSRSVLEELRHVTIGLEMTSARLRGDQFDFVARENADAAKPKTRASVVSEMEAAIAVSYPLVEKSPKPLLVGWIDHQAEHYG